MNEKPEADVYSVSVSEDKAGQRLDRVLAESIRGVSRTRMQALMRDGWVRELDSGVTIDDPSAKAKGELHYLVMMPPPQAAAPQPQDIPLNVVYEDEHLIVIDKPAGLVVHPGPGNLDGTLVNALLAHCKGSLSGIGGVERPGIVHRLDKDTSGLMVAAKSDAAHAGLSEQFAAHSLERAYKAVVWGVPNPSEGEVEGNIGRSPADRKKMAVVKRGGKPALTRYRVLEVLGSGVASLVECRLATGRTHQIRVHMASLGHAVVGDPIYGRRPRGVPEAARRAEKTIGRQALHAFLIGFCHPVRHTNISFVSKISCDINGLKNNLDRS